MFLALALSVALAQDDGKVTLPLTRWEEMLDEAEKAEEQPIAPVPFLQIDRSIEGSFRRGVFTGTLVTRVFVPPGYEESRVPLLDADASIARVELDGRMTSLLPEGGNYTVAVGSPGTHTIRVEFFTGREDDRFDRRLSLSLPASGPTSLSLWLPEVDIEPDIAQGAVTGLRAEGGGTRLVGQLDGRGRLELTWRGKNLGEAVPVKVEARQHTLFTLHEALVRGVAVIDTTVLEGETDRVSLRLPEGVEVVDVTGDAVLQWRTEPGRLDVLLRYLVDDRTTVRVNFQLPVDLDQPITLAMPLPAEGVPYTGSIGVQGPAGLQAVVQSASGAETLRDLPPELAALTPNPLLLGFELTGDPSVVLAVTRQTEVELTSTVIDDLEAATVLIEDGAEITKLQLHVRNQTRQYLAVKLPEGAVLTQARIDDRPVRPATSPDGTTLLLPLMQSERLAAGQERTWTVRAGDTLDTIADKVYGDPSRWNDIFDNNRDQLFSDELSVGQVLRVPATGEAASTSRFVIELVWTREAPSMGWLGRRALRLPEFDADVGAAEWHVYVPDTFEPLSFGGNLTPYSHLRYDHIRRLRTYLNLAFEVQNAWAGGRESYSNILSRRKSIYADEFFKGGEATEATGAFPMVGERYRFRRMFPGREVPQLALSWIARELLPGVRLGALLLAAWLTWTALGGAKRGRTALGFGALLLVAWYVQGVHKATLWGVDLALLAALGRRMAPELLEGLRSPSRAALLDAWSFRTLRRALLLSVALGALLMVPLLWSSIALVALTLKLRRAA